MALQIVIQYVNCKYLDVSNVQASYIFVSTRENQMRRFSNLSTDEISKYSQLKWRCSVCQIFVLFTSRMTSLDVLTFLYLETNR